MTLHEYLYQTNPRRMPKVELEEWEFRKHQTIKVGVDTLTSIEIPALWERFKVGGVYIQINNERCLRVQDEDGNPGSYSCFHLPEVNNPL